MSTTLAAPERSLRSIAMVCMGLLLLLEGWAVSVHLAAAARGGSAFYELYQAALSLRGAGGATAEGPAGCQALLALPFSFLPYAAAYWVVFALNLGLLGLSYWRARPYLLRLERAWRPLPLGLYVCFFPVAMALVDGTTSLLLLALLTLSATTYYKGHDTYAGLLLGLAMFDWQYALPMAVLFLAWRKWRLVAGFAVTGVAVGAMALGVTRGHGWRWLVHTSHYTDWAFPFLLPNPHLLLDRGLLPDHSVGLGLLAVGVLLMVWAATRPANYALALAVALLASVHGAAHDLVLLILPMGFVLLSRVVQTSVREVFSKCIMGAMFVAPAVVYATGMGEWVVALLLVGMLIPLRSLY